MKLFFFVLGIILGSIIAILKNSSDLVELKIPNAIDNGHFLISILTANKFLETRAKAIKETWAKDHNHMLFFSQSKQTKTSLPVIFLPGTDDSYPPQKKSFTMFKFLHDNYLNSFDWFIRVDDDAYIKVNRLKSFLNQLDPSETLYIGQPGFEHSPDYPFCMGGTGVILSRETLKKVGPHLNECYQKMIQSEHEDVEIGRCIKRFANVSCTQSYEMKSIFYQLYLKQNDTLFQSSSLNVFKKTIGIHPLKKIEQLYSIHLSELKNKILFLREKIFRLNNFKINDESENLKFFDRFSVYDLDSEQPKSGLQSDLKSLIYSLNDEISDKILKQNSGFLKSSIISGYFDIDPYENFKVSFKNELSYFQNNKSVLYIQNLVLQVPFLDFIINQKTTSINVTVNFLLAICDCTDRFKIFLDNFHRNILKSSENTRLIVIVCKNDSKIIKEIIENKSLAHLKKSVIVLELNHEFKRGVYLNQGSKIVPNDEIIFFIDVDFLFNSDILNRIRLNTLSNYQVFMPIFFSKFSYGAGLDDNSSLFNLKKGEWRYFSFGAISIFKKDFLRTGFNESITGWGNEDIDIAENIINLNGIKVFRAVDNGIIHLFHDKKCDKNLPNEQFQMCLKSKIRIHGLKNLKLNL